MQAMTELMEFWVDGIPAPKGSRKNFLVRRKDGKMGINSVNANTRTKGWEQKIREKAKKVPNLTVLGGSVAVWLLFVMPRPGYHARKKDAPKLPITRPDLDKLARAACDALTGVMFKDDSQVTLLWSRKIYGPEPGVRVTVKYDDVGVEYFADKQAKKRKQKVAELRERFQRRLQSRPAEKMISPNPRYDDVFEEGASWLDDAW
jgi:Holliday junction resolvase RusA-like endonuclease